MKYFEKKEIEWCMRVLVCAAVLLILISRGSVAVIPRTERATRLSEGWYYMDGDEQVYVTLPALIRQEKGDSLTLFNDGLPKDAGNFMLTTRGAVYRLKISVAEKTLYQYEDAGFPRNKQMASKVNCTVRLPKDFAGETISFTYYNINDGVYQIPEICFGSEMEVFLYQCGKDVITLGIVLVMAILGIITVCIAVYIRHKGVYEKRFLDISFFLLLCVCWFLTDSSLAQTIGGPSPVIRYISFYAFMLFAVPMIHFVKDTGDMKKYPVINLVIYIFYANVILQSVLNYFGIFDFVDMLFVTHLLLIGGIGVLITLLVREYKKSESKELLTILQSFIMVAGGGVIALILYWLLKISYYEVFFECGIVVMIIVLMRSLIAGMVQNFRFKTESIVYQRLASEDILTGMKNRRAFDTLLTEIQENINSYQNVFLVFMDVNRLKNVNDNLGYNVGDEVIIATARIVDKAYGKDGQCFRIGGTEFCAVLADSTFKEEDLSLKLDAEIRLYNKTCSRYQLSVARGISSLRDDKGNLKTISDWKKEADLKMYADKGWIKKAGGNDK